MERIRTTIHLRKELWEELKIMSIKQGKTLNEIIETLLEREIYQRNNKKLLEDI